MSENLLKAACTRAEFMAAQKAGIWVMTTEDEQAIHDFAEAIREEQRACIAELESEIVPAREMLEDARTQLDMIREALGVSVEPHQSLFERVIERARRVEALQRINGLSSRALTTLIESDNGGISSASEDELCSAANDVEAPEIVRKQAAAILRARSALAAAQKQERSGGLWAIHIPGPDEYYAAPSEEAAKYMAKRHNEAMSAYFEKNPPNEFSVPIESALATPVKWPFDAESHDEEMKEFDYSGWGIEQKQEGGDK